MQSTTQPPSAAMISSRRCGCRGVLVLSSLQQFTGVLVFISQGNGAVFQRCSELDFDFQLQKERETGQRPKKGTGNSDGSVEIREGEPQTRRCPQMEE